jgi:hypothetical protein
VVEDEVAVPVIRMRFLAIAAALIISWSGDCFGDPPTDVIACNPACRELYPAAFMLDCRDELGDEVFWWENWCRTWYGPLRYVGPIEVAVQARPWPGHEPLPLFVQIRRDQGAAQCRSDAGGPTWSTYGTESCNPDSLWSVLPRTTLINTPINTTYYVQLIGFLIVSPVRASSPFVACIRVTSYPTEVTSRSWGQVKALYRD